MLKKNIYVGPFSWFLVTTLTIFINLFPQKTADLVTSTEEIVNGKLRFLCSESFHFILPEKNRKQTVNKRLIMVIKREHWPEMG